MVPARMDSMMVSYHVVISLKKPLSQEGIPSQVFSSFSVRYHSFQGSRPRSSLFFTQLQQPISVQCKTVLLGLYYYRKVPHPQHHHTTSVSLYLKPSRSWKTKQNNFKQNKAIQHYIVKSFNQYHIVQNFTIVKIYDIQVIPSYTFKQCTLPNWSEVK